MDGPFNSIVTAIRDAPVADTHEHLRPVDSLGPMNFTGLLRHSYLTRSLRSSDGSANGLGQNLEIALEEDSWETVEAVVRRVRCTSYYRWLMKGVADLYAVPDVELDRPTWEHLSGEIARRYADPTWMSTALDRANIQLIIWDPNWTPGSTTAPDRRARPSLRINSGVAAFHPEASDGEGHNIIREWASELNVDVATLSDLESLIDKVVDNNIQGGARSLKSALAYDRTIAIDATPRPVAERIFGTPPSRIDPAERKAFGDYIVHFYLDRARDRNLVVQFHTGLARLSGSNPLLIEPLLQAYPDVIFDVFHGGYPWVHEAGALAHNYPNVRLNLTWLPQLSTELTAAVIKEYLQVVPQLDRITWGGDCRTVEESYGALLGLKHALARSISELVVDGYFDLQTGIDAALNILYGAGESIYGPPPSTPQTS